MPAARNDRLRQNTLAAQVDEQEKANKAIAAILRGMTYEQAAKVAGYATKAGAWKAVHRHLDALAGEIAQNAEALRALEVARLDRMLMELSTVALSGSTPLDLKLKYLEAMRRNVETRANLLGLNAPVQHEVFTHDALDLKIRELSDRLGLPVPERLLELPSGGRGRGAAAAPAPDPAGPPEDRA
jgi:DNA-directed RNA polymerase specialized sigma24 family protein